MQAKSSDFNRNFSGFGGQYGYYTDAETVLVLLTHRCYDPSFVLFSLPSGPTKRLVRRQP